MNIVGVIVARMTSSRLPGKPLLKLAGRTSLERHVERLRKVSGISCVYLGTSRGDENAALVEEAKRIGIEVYMGSEEDVVERFVTIGEMSRADALVRIGCDKPLFCYELLQKSVREYSGEDYIFLRAGVTSGVTHEIISLRALKEAHRHYRGTAIAQHMREHPHCFMIRPVSADPVYCRPEYRLSLDTVEDYQLLSCIYEAMAPRYDVIPTKEALKYLDDNPEAALLNRNVEEKNVNSYSLSLEKKPVFSVHMTDDGKYSVYGRTGTLVSYAEFVNCVSDKRRWNKV